MQGEREQQQVQREKVVLLQLPAGMDAAGNPVLEHAEAYALTKANHYELIRSPLFIRNLARGDIFHLNPHRPQDISVILRSGMLALRVFRKAGLDELEAQLSPEVEKLGGSLDIRSERGLSYSLHVNTGFAPIEALFDGMMADFAGSVWYYGNIYDPADGMTPLHWWDRFLNEI